MEFPEGAAFIARRDDPSPPNGASPLLAAGWLCLKPVSYCRFKYFKVYIF